jgi:hypothetical protein
MTNWYLLRGNAALGLVLIISKSNVVVKITAGKMIELSLSTFGDVSILLHGSILVELQIYLLISALFHTLDAQTIYAFFQS